MKKNTVYLTLSAEIIHHGHINIINKASKIGNLTIGLLTDKAIAEKKQLPLLNWQQRKSILENITGVKKIIPQYKWDDSINILKYKPQFVIHGDDWIKGDRHLRTRVKKALKSYGGKLVEIPFTKNISSTSIRSKVLELGSNSASKRNMLERLISSKKLVRIIEAHSPLSAIIAEKISFDTKTEKKEFDGFWSSSLTDSTLKGKPDIEVLETAQRLANINEIFDVTSKPLILDADTGGKLEHFEINIKSIERSGVSAVIIEDKKGLKKNSLFGTSVKQEQEDIKTFCNKIKLGNKSIANKELMIFARIESFILGKGLNDALKRANSYIDAGAKGIMIHSKLNKPTEVFKFAEKFRKTNNKTPLIVVPSSFSAVRENELINHGFNIVIYANHLLRASYPAMLNTARMILKNGRAKEAEKKLMKIKEILELIPGTK